MLIACSLYVLLQLFFLVIFEFAHFNRIVSHFHIYCVFVCVQTEPEEVKLESERADSHDVDLPISIVYNDTDSLAHPAVSSHFESSHCFRFGCF